MKKINTVVCHIEAGDMILWKLTPREVTILQEAFNIIHREQILSLDRARELKEAWGL